MNSDTQNPKNLFSGTFITDKSREMLIRGDIRNDKNIELIEKNNITMYEELDVEQPLTQQKIQNDPNWLIVHSWDGAVYKMYKSTLSRGYGAFGILCMGFFFYTLLCINGICSILSINGIFCFGSINSILSIGSVNSILSVGCANSVMKICLYGYYH